MVIIFVYDSLGKLLKTLIAIAVLFFATFSNSFAVEVSGYLLGYDGKPMPLAHIHYKNGDKEITKQVEADGSFKFKTDNKIYLELSFTGVNHKQSIFDIYLAEIKNTNLTVRLSPNTFKDAKNSINLTGNFNNYSFEDGLAKLEKISENKYAATLDYKLDTLIYQLIIGYDAAAHSVNGQQQNYYQYDGGGDYRSVLVTNKKDVRIEFDLSKYPTTSTPAKITSDNDEYNRIMDVANAGNQLFENSMRSFSRIISLKNQVSGEISKKLTENKLNYMDSLSILIDKEKNPSLRTILIGKYFSVASDGTTLDEVKHKVNIKYAKEILNALKPNSEYFEINDIKFTSVHAVRAMEKLENSKYLSDFDRLHKDEETRSQFISDMLGYFKKDNDTVNIKKYLAKVMKEYPKTDAAKYARLSYSDDLIIKVGKQIPKFELTSIDDTTQTISSESILGKYTMIDFWGTWCGPCLMEMEYVDKAYKRFKGKNFQILSIALDASPGRVIKFREGKWKMPWMHAFADGMFKSIIAETFEITGVPTVLLIDPSGKIVEKNYVLRGEKLEGTLEKYLGE